VVRNGLPRSPLSAL